ncbi:MAG: CPBP family intramembrane metalloprotease [Lachnospiraceae bacterium]|nr:CPBP family intramembrane metalloprotease [Lachnospiraceae bacterium]MDD7668475.1 CPBP family intramembrane metalloprotease [Lachnospiraceae bacterium]MDY2620978.1 CPBP family intramembrane glutamic endopeptidase [Agathobacter sp.]
MKDLFERSVPMQETAQTKKGLLWILELLVFVAVFLVASIAQGFATVPMQLVMLFSDKAYMAAVASGDVAKLTEASMEVTQRLMESDGYMIGMLLSDIVMMLIVFLFCRFIQKRKLRTLGFIKKGMLKEYGLGMLLGFAFFSVCVLLGVLFGGLKIEGISPEFSIGIFVAYLLGYMVQGMTEEVLCRGYFLGSYARRYPVYAAVLANSLLFASLHLLNSGISVLAFINITLFGIFASIYFIRRGSIWGIGAFHSIWNLVQGNFYGIKVSGTPVGNTLFTTQAIAGKSLWNGGDFGMEGSLICTIVLTCGIIFLYTRKNKDTVEA